MLKTATQPTAPIVIDNAPNQHIRSTLNNIPMTASIEDILNVPPKGCRKPEEDSQVVPIILQEDNNEYIEEGGSQEPW